MPLNLADAIKTEEGWDGNFASPTTPAARVIAEVSSWIPTVDGGLTWELHASGLGIEVSISDVGEIDVYIGRS